MGKLMDKLRDQKIIVVGGTSGIGFGAAEALLDAGAKVTVISSSQDRVNDAVRRLNSPNVSGTTADVRDEVAFVQVLQSLAPVDHIVFSGVDKIIRGKLEDLDLNDAKFLFGVKFWGAVVVGKAVLKHDIIRKGGSLTLTSGMAAVKPGKGAAVGGGLNGGVCSLTKGLASDLAEKKIRVNTVVPGLVQTELWDKLGKSAEQQKKEFAEASRRLPVGFVATPQDIAEAYLYAIRANYANGSLIEIGGIRSADAQFIFELLEFVTTPVVLNIAEYAPVKGVKSNMVAERIGVIAKRYNLKLATTTVGCSGTAPNPAPRKTTAQKRKNVAVRKEDLDAVHAVDGNGSSDDDSDSEGSPEKKQRVDDDID